VRPLAQRITAPGRGRQHAAARRQLGGQAVAERQSQQHSLRVGSLPQPQSVRLGAMRRCAARRTSSGLVSHSERAGAALSTECRACALTSPSISSRIAAPASRK